MSTFTRWRSSLDDKTPVEINITADGRTGGYTVKWITGEENGRTGHYVTGQRAVGDLQAAVLLVTNLCTEKH